MWDAYQTTIARTRNANVQTRQDDGNDGGKGVEETVLLGSMEVGAVMIEEQSWVEPFRRFIGLELRLTEYKEGRYAKYDVISPTGETLFFVASYFDSDSIGSTDGPFCTWRPK